MTELKTCPFCGGEAELLQEDNGWWTCFCERCCVEILPCDKAETAITAWNRRVSNGK